MTATRAWPTVDAADRRDAGAATPGSDEPTCGPALGIGWRPEVAGVAADRPDLAFVEVVAESIPGEGCPLPLGLALLLEQGVPVLTHGLGLSLGSAERPSAGRLALLADVATRLGSPVVSEHLAFVRAGGRSAGHLVPVPRTRRVARLLADHITEAQDQLPVPLAVESPAALLDWPDDELDEADFVTEVVERSGAGLLLDLANLYVNARNRGADPLAVLDRMPLERLAYVHVAGGHVRSGLHHDTHAAPVWPDVLDLTSELVARVPDAWVMLERDDRFAGAADLDGELDAISAALRVPVSSGPRRPGAPRSRVPTAVAVADPVSTAERNGLAADQVRLLESLVGAAPAPPGFDRERVAVVRASLRAKRIREVAVRWPATAAWMGEDLAERFGAYADRCPVPAHGGPTSDGACFIAGLGRGAGDDAARQEWRRAGAATGWRRRW